MTTRMCLIAMFAAVCAVARSPSASAHPLSPSLVRITLGDGVHDVTICVSKAGRRPVLRSGCHIESIAPDAALAFETAMTPDADRLVIHERWTCSADASVALVASPDDPPVIVERIDQGRRNTTVLDAGHPHFVLSMALAPSLVRWLGIGFEHLVGGPDHVLIVLGLLALIGWRRRLVWALTAFTIGHSLALVLGATGLVTLPVAVVEVAIALTLVALGLELATPGARPGLIARRVWIGGLLIGLVHGLGFAGALSELMRGDALAAPLVGFNLGLELAQLALVVAVFSLVALATSTARLFAKLSEPRSRAATRSLVSESTPWRGVSVRSATGWLIGIVGAAWVFDRAWPG